MNSRLIRHFAALIGAGVLVAADCAYGAATAAPTAPAPLRAPGTPVPTPAGPGPVQGVKPATSQSPPGTFTNGTISVAPPGTPGVPSAPVQGVQLPTSSAPPGASTNGTVSTVPAGTIAPPSPGTPAARGNLTPPNPTMPPIGGSLTPAQNGVPRTTMPPIGGSVRPPNAGFANPGAGTGAGAGQGLTPGLVPGTLPANNRVAFANPGGNQFHPSPGTNGIVFGNMEDRDRDDTRFRRRRHEGIFLRGTNVEFRTVPANRSATISTNGTSAAPGTPTEPNAAPRQ